MTTKTIATRKNSTARRLRKLHNKIENEQFAQRTERLIQRIFFYLSAEAATNGKYVMYGQVREYIRV